VPRLAAFLLFKRPSSTCQVEPAVEPTTETDEPLITLPEFKHHIQLHRQRVLKLGMMLGAEHFPALNPNDLERFLRLHDRSKVLRSTAQLRIFGYNHPQIPLDRLHAFFGKRQRTPEEAHQLRQVIDDINNVDLAISKRFFETLPIPPSTISEFYQVEKVADLVDRSLDPIAAEEFGHPMILASEFIGDSRLAKMSLWLESRYFEVTAGLFFPNAENLVDTKQA
jgi:hypothetical protein